MAKFAFLCHRSNRGRTLKVLIAVAGALTCAASALAGGTVLPPNATPNGYSLSDMAVATAAYNDIGDSEPIPDVPFEVLVGSVADYSVRPGTMLYVPVFYADNSLPLVVSPYPKDLQDPTADTDYLLDCADADSPPGTEIEAFLVQVDGKTTVLSDDYSVGVKIKLSDSADRYIVAAAFVAPLTPGEHTVGVGGIIGGAPVVFLSYTVTVAEGDVLPPCATPKGYSLSDMAVDTAAYNVGDDIGQTEPLPKVPFEVLVGSIADYTVEPGTTLYVPVIFADNAPPLAVSPFPTDLQDSEVDADYLLDIAGGGVEAFIVQVDGKTTILCDDYAVGVKTAKLPDKGDRYIVSAAFVKPLAVGAHTVGIGGIIAGEPVVFISYTVTVKP